MAVAMIVAGAGLTGWAAVSRPAAAQVGPSLLRSQTRVLQRAIETQIRQAVRPRLTIRSGAIDTVTAAGAAPTGAWLATVLSDDTLRLWDLRRGGEVLAAALPFTATAVAVAEDGGLAAAIAADGRAALVLAATGGEVTPLPAVADARAVAVVPGLAVFGRADGAVLGVTADGRAGPPLRLGAAVVSLRAVDGASLAAGLSDGTVIRLSRQGTALAPAGRWSLGLAVSHLDAAGGVLLARTGDGTVSALAADGRRAWTRSLGAAQAMVAVPDAGLALLDGHDLRLVAFDDGRDLGRFTIEMDAPRALAAPAARRLLVAGAGGRATVHDLPSGRPLVSLYSTKVGWAAIDAEGRFDGTDRSVRDVAWDLDGQLVDIDRFAGRYFEPGVAVKALSGGPMLTAPGHTLDDGMLPPPEVTLQAGPAAAPGQPVTITVTATVQGRPAEGEDPRLWLFRNGKRVPPEAIGARDATTTGNRTTWTWRASLPADPGDTVFEATVLGWNDIQATSPPVTVSVAAPEAGPRFFVSGVGIDAYAGPQLRLNFAVADARAIADTFLDTSAGGLTAEKRVSVLTLDDAATREAILARIAEMRDSQPGDVLTVFLSGHARAIGADWYFLPSEALSLAHDAHVRQVGISAEELATALMAVPAERIVLIIDACQSGAAVGAFETFGQRRALNGVAQSTGVTVMAATRADQLAPEYSDLGHGIFTYTLLNGLRKNAQGSYNADRWPADGKVMIGELRRYVETYVPLLARQLDAKYQSATRGQSLADRAPVTPTSTPVAADFAVR
jgi:hypothetical protein